MKSLKTPFSQSISTTGTTISSSAHPGNNDASTIEHLLSFKEPDTRYKRVQEIKEKYQQNKKKESPFGTLIDIESSTIQNTQQQQIKTQSQKNNNTVSNIIIITLFSSLDIPPPSCLNHSHSCVVQ